MIMFPCLCDGLPYVGQLIHRDDILYGVYCIMCGVNGGIEWDEDDAIMKWNTKIMLRTKAIKVYDEEQYDTVVKRLDSHHRVAHEPKRDKDTGKILLEEFPIYVQLVWLPKCGHFTRCYPKNTVHCNYVEFREEF